MEVWLAVMISQLHLFIGIESDGSVVALSADRYATDENKYCKVLGSWEQLSEVELR